MLEYILRWIAILVMFILNIAILYYAVYITKYKVLKILLIFMYVFVIVVISVFIIFQIFVRKYI